METGTNIALMLASIPTSKCRPPKAPRDEFDLLYTLVGSGFSISMLHASILIYKIYYIII